MIVVVGHLTIDPAQREVVEGLIHKLVEATPRSTKMF